jgi:hypothetical protein
MVSHLNQEIPNLSERSATFIDRHAPDHIVQFDKLVGNAGHRKNAANPTRQSYELLDSMIIAVCERKIGAPATG